MEILKKKEFPYFYELLEKLFYLNCYDYYLLENFILNNMFYGVQYGNKKIFLKHVFIFFEMKKIKETAFVLTLN